MVRAACKSAQLARTMSLRKRIDHGNNALFEPFQVITQQRSDDQLQGLIAATVAAIIFLAPFMWGRVFLRRIWKAKASCCRKSQKFARTLIQERSWFFLHCWPL